MAIKLVIDSTADATEEQVKRLGLNVVPLVVNFGEKSYLDGVDIVRDEFFAKLATSEKLPTTSQPAPASFVKMYEELAGPDDEIISILLSSKLSGTCESAKMAKEIIGSDKIHIIDSGSASIGIMLIVEKAYELISQGLSAKEIVAQLEEFKSKVIIYVGVDTLKYLEKGGRLSKGAAVIGTMLNFKPIIKIKNGVLESVDKVRGKAKMLNWLEETAEKNINVKNGRVGVFHSQNEELALNLKGKIEEKFEGVETIVAEVGCVIGTHIGPNAVAVAYVEN